jgi:hypothetical protein
LVLNAASIQLEPLSSSDWELLEIYSSDLENGGLLRQISIVYPNQLLTLTLGRDVVHVRVLSQGFMSVLSDHNHRQQHQQTSHDGKKNIMNQDYPTCLRLIADTQVIITPKPRNPHRPQLEIPQELRTGCRKRLRVQPHMEHFNPKMMEIHAVCTSSRSPFFAKGLHQQDAKKCFQDQTAYHQPSRMTDKSQLGPSISSPVFGRRFPSDDDLLDKIDGCTHAENGNSVAISLDTWRPDASSLDEECLCSTPQVRENRHLSNDDASGCHVSREIAKPLQCSAWVHPSILSNRSSSDRFVACVWKHVIPICEEAVIPEGTNIFSSASRLQYPFLNNMAIINLHPSTCVDKDHIGKFVRWRS